MTDDRQPDDTPLTWASAWLTGTVRNAEDLDLEEAWTVWVLTHHEWRERVTADLGLPEELADPEPDKAHWHWQECAPDVIGELRGSLPDDLAIGSCLGLTDVTPAETVDRVTVVFAWPNLEQAPHRFKAGAIVGPGVTVEKVEGGWQVVSVERDWPIPAWLAEPRT